MKYYTHHFYNNVYKLVTKIFVLLVVKTFEKFIMNKITAFISLFCFKILTRFKAKITVLKNQRAKANFTKVDYSYYANEVNKFKIEMTVLENKFLQLRKGNMVHNILDSYTDFDGRASLDIAGDKVLCGSILKKAGIPVPSYVVLNSGDYKNAIAFKKRINDGPIVIKPARNTGDSRGVVIKPETFFSIWLAVNYAGIYGKEIIVEEYFDGINYRLLFCNGNFLAASSRIPAFVVGDGVHAVRKLIEYENKDRLENGKYLKYDPTTRPILYKIPITKSLVNCIKKQGYGLNSVPVKDAIIRLQEICHWLYGGQYFDVTDIILPKLINISQKAVELIGIKLAGVDVIAQDIRNPREGTYIINEINTTPGLLVHYEVQNQDKMRPVCREILKMMFDIE